ncbi:MAG: hypothetical protein U0269_23080 [Polyangiales bacterium]
MVDRRLVGICALVCFPLACVAPAPRDAGSDSTASDVGDAGADIIEAESRADVASVEDAASVDAASAGDAGGGDSSSDVVTDSAVRCESDRELCDVFGFECGPVAVTDSCGRTRSVECGACFVGYCGASGAIGRCGLLVAPAESLVGGLPTRVYPSRFETSATLMEAVSPDELWMAVGAPSPLFRWRRGRALDAHAPPASGGRAAGAPNALSASGPDAVHAAWPTWGDSVARFDGTSFRWLSRPARTSYGFRTLLSLGADELWAADCGGGAEIQRWDGASWTEYPIAAGACVQRIWREPAGDVFALAGPNATQLLRLAPGSTTFVVDPTLSGAGIIDYVRTTDGEYAQTRSALLYRPRPSVAWSAVAARVAGEGRLRAFGAELWASFADGVVVVRGGVVQSSIASDGLVAVSAPDRAFVRRGAAIFDARASSPLSAPVLGLFFPSESCVDMRPRGAALAYGLCSVGARRWLTRVAEREGWTWLSETPAETTRAFWMSASSSVWSATTSGAIEQRDADSGRVLAVHDIVRGSTVERIAGSSDRDVWAITTTRSVARFDGSAWRVLALSSPIAGALVDVVATPSELWVFTASSIARVAPSGAVATVARPSSEPITSVAVSPEGRVWVRSLVNDALRCFGTAYEFDGSAWAPHPMDCTGNAGNLFALDATPAGVFAVRERLTVLLLQRWTGSAWSDPVEFGGPSFAYTQQSRVRVVSESDLWIGGYRARL